MTPAPAGSIEATITYAEITQQPTVWRELDTMITRRQDEIAPFVASLLARPDLRIVLSGAGTSAFVGEILAPALTRRLGRRVDAVATTDVVADPYAVFAEDVPTLLVSFARSGDSPESVATTEFAEQCLSEVHHLVITCNPAGRLARDHQASGSSLVVLMPAASNDRGFAMTSSFTAMLLATWRVLSGTPDGTPEDDGNDPVVITALADSAEALLADLTPYAAVAAGGYARIVFLGSGSLAGLAHEAALKLLELTAGKVISYFDTALGFRHGPKSVIDEQTLVIVYRSADPYTARYDEDIAAELRATTAAEVIMVSADPAHASAGDWILDGAGGLADVPLAALYAITAQLLGLHLSIALGCTPDNPFPTGEVNRVVQGVTVHPLV